MWNKIKQTFTAFLLTGIHVYLLIFIMEWIYRGSFQEAYTWVKGFTKPFTYNFILLVLFFSVLRIFRRKIYIIASFVLTVPFIILSIASRIKLEIRGEPVIPSDLVMGAEAANMVEYFSNQVLIGLIVGLIVVIVLLAFLVYKVPNQQKRNWIQIVTAISLFLTFLFILNREIKNEDTFLKRNFNISYLAWDQKATTSQDGVIAGFVLNLKWLTLDSPGNYSKQEIERIIHSTEAPSYQDNDKPNVVVIMSEAFWDPLELKNVQFNKDPLSYFHQLQKEGTSGWLTVPVFGGSTANTEFEALTGISTQFLPAGSIPYLHYVKNPLPSLPTIFRNHGYEATAIHTYHHWFYQRSSVYQNLGFDRFVSLEYIANPIPDQNFIHDKTITDEIMRKINQKSDKPNFIFAVTTQNHGPYPTVGKKDNANIEVELKNGKSFSEDAENLLEVYSDNLTDVDKELKSLISQLKETKKKTIVVFFGDHLPLLGDDYKVYREAEYYNESQDFAEYERMFSTPILIWDNYSNKKENLTISANMIGPLLLDRVGIRGNYLTDYLLDQYKKGSLTRITRPDFLPQQKVDEKIVNEIKMLQYDMLFGNKYGIRDKKDFQPSPKYRLGYKNPKITDAFVETSDGKKILVIKGEYFTGRSYVYVNNEYIERLSGNENEIRVPLPKNSSSMDIVVKVMDSNEKVLSESNTFKWEK
ncbi:sulfatase-like hydrolase/transferase [Neobacillus thermocopriae]|uniref:sulfatase-like hydrolase/transferase n=1 Tax=Neobacillus thermocopriae TaxID=1215031 RepID=UPI002E1E5C77|nr:sulfatase-like hydrolase/transferase [Neobacillus thermocopriae]MED3622528.1 sulfatase-like hydrolase/transferase [Neobacillus thermocopriae]MED3712632.1 sulfatase-like hydrolase/transferase [Neobacillus thermocopriae]